MTNQSASRTREVLWGLLATYVLFAILYAAYIAVLLHKQSQFDAGPKTGSFPPLWCGNTIIEPLALLLNWGSPLALLASIRLCVFHEGNHTPNWPVSVALFAIPTLSLLGFAIWVTHGPWFAGACRVADFVWWAFGV